MWPIKENVEKFKFKIGTQRTDISSAAYIIQYEKD